MLNARQIPRETAKSWIQTYLLDVFLPAGYPHSVTEDYLPYVSTFATQSNTGSLCYLGQELLY
jgi:hypothetical protein